jgi:hypothetical protein
MRYPDGQEARLGDRVQLWEHNEGTVVCSLDTNEYTSDYPRERWQYLGSGVLILSEAAGLIHYKEPEPTTKLLFRGGPV